MDGQAQSISPSDLYARLGTQHAPLLIDVRKSQAFDDDTVRIIGAVRRRPDEVGDWGAKLAAKRLVIAYCVHGHEVSQGVAAALRAQGFDAGFLEGGIVDWRERNYPTRRKRGPAETVWITREHPKIDRIACPWLVSRFIEPDAKFVYVPTDQVATAATKLGGTPYDIDHTEFSHIGDQCSFDAIVRIYGIEDAALDRLAAIVRGAYTSRLDLTPQCEGLLVISRGLSAHFPDDHEMLEHGLVIYDALYAWCRMQVENNSIEKS